MTEEVKDTDSISTEKGEESFRDYTKRLEKENKELRGYAKTNLFKEVGLDPTQGTGKMAADLYAGKLDSSELSTWLSDNYGINADQNVNQNDSVAANKMLEADQRSETIQKVSAPIGEEDPRQVLDEIIQKGSPAESIRAKMYMQERMKKEQN
jgi:hypothetical protein|tara:strand:- start:1232 stop:1690 length:459 start_codon:yes stop_codon:yes gene_type:complete